MVANSRKPRLANWLIGLVASGVAGLVISHFAKWFDGLRPADLFVTVFGIVAIVWYGTEWFYRREYSRDYVSEIHLEGLKNTVKKISEAVLAKKTTIEVNGKDCQDLFSHRRDIKKACEAWDSAVSQSSQARWEYEKKLSHAFAENNFTEERFNRAALIQAIKEATFNREQLTQRQIGPRQDMKWIWDEVPADRDPRLRHDIFLRAGNGILFIRDFDNVEDPVNVEDCENRLIEIFNEADSSPELVDWVTKTMDLDQNAKFMQLKELLHDFGRLTQLRHGRGCAQCNS